MKKFAAFMAIVVAVTFSAGLVIGADAPGKVTLDSIQKAKGPVQFNHKAHAEKRAKDCQVCHHKDAAKAEQKCSACHKAKAEGKTVSLKDAYHTTCKNCHKKMGGPKGCKECHKK